MFHPYDNINTSAIFNEVFQMTILDFPLIEGLKFINLINEGSFAKVFRAETKEGIQVAVKCLNKANMDNNTLKNLYAEPKILSRLNHPKVVKLLQVVENRETLFLVQEYCETDMFEIIVSQVSKEKTRDLFSQLCSSVAYCHSQSIFHRDIKPENILLKDGCVKLADFGLATKRHLSGEFHIGSCRYMSAEVFATPTKNQEPYMSSANDVWAIGIILINLLTGHNPWNEPTASNKRFRAYQKNPKKYLQTQFKFSDELCAVLERVFNLDPYSRPSALEFQKMVESIPYCMPSSSEMGDSKHEAAMLNRDDGAHLSNESSDPMHHHCQRTKTHAHPCWCSNKMSLTQFLMGLAKRSVTEMPNQKNATEGLRRDSGACLLDYMSP
jgi:serine/threonine protein kinase